MNSPTASTKSFCSHRSEIAAYIDGDLPPREELKLEMHITMCRSCGEELNEQKKLLCALDSVLESEREIELPADFTRHVVIRAENNVNGLRRPQERSKALFVCAALFLTVLLGLGAETEIIFNSFGKFVEQILAVGGFAWNLIYDLSVGAAVILRSLGSRFLFNSATSLAILAVFVFLSLFLFSRITGSQRS